MVSSELDINIMHMWLEYYFSWKVLEASKADNIFNEATEVSSIFYVQPIAFLKRRTFY